MGAYLPPALREGAAGSVQEGAQPPDDVGTSLNAPRPSIAESLDGSENVQTLDYLGLADARNSISSVADHSADERRPSSHFVNARNRASTLATAPRNAGNSPGFVLRSTPEHGFDDVSPLAYGDEEVYAAFAREHGIDPAAFAAAAAAAGLPAGLPPQNQQSHAALVGGRLRAGTVAALGGPGGRHRVEQELLRLAAASQFLDTNNSTGHAGAQERREALSALGIGNYAHAPMEGFPHVSVSTPPADTPSFLTRPSQTLARKESGLQTPVTPGAEHRSSPQIPGRSLWIGQLSAGTTGQELMQMFAPYGAIESLRLLPEKECGFVNFVEAADAIRAKDDIMQRQGGRVGKGTGPNGAIRIGYGKIDSVPSAPPMSSGYSTPGLQARGLNSPRVETPGLGDPAPGTPGEIGPTRALWVGSIPANTTNNTLMSIFQPFGPIESVRVLSHKNCGFINFERVDDAVLARKMLNGRDVLGSETGSMRIGFAKVPTRAADDLPSDPSNAGFAAAVNALSGLNGAASAPISAEQQLASGGIENYRSNLVADLLAKQHRQSQAVHLAHGSSQGGSGLASVSSHGRGASLAGKSASSSIVPSSDKGGVPLPADMQPRPATSDLQLLMRELSADDPASVEADVASVANARSPASYYTTIPLVSEQSASRRFDTSRLRELRKHIESASCTVEQVDAVAADHMDAIVDLAHDYIGNTVVQKLFERCSDRIKHVMLERIAPHLAMIGIHKNGTWAAQKIIETSVNPAQVSIIAQNLRPYVPPLLLDQFGNYVKSEPEASEVILDALFTSPDEDVLQEVITDQVHGSQFITKVLAWISSDGDQYPKYSEQVRRIVVEHSLLLGKLAVPGSCLEMT
ncbi:RNA-binding protein (contains RRM and Pumilio-like repeats) [Ceraceosorus bombacis]|uniref:RNA-binding protein (Contains RRM and Pumilio-like repeats) n=1 Tax=Ceraceosorus bombacis TaxID=401625 RepID=A0A0P1BB17_9BASI|nr:RNA-binding protein (contains RRM and Pumilio-like repeats) [Ceraceosorus bombacis]